MKHPLQPIEFVGNVIRFRRNEIIEYLFDTGALDLNKLATMDFDDEDRMQHEAGRLRPRRRRQTVGLTL